MNTSMANDDRLQQNQRLFPSGLLNYVAAAGFAVPIGAVAWFEMGYLAFGLTTEDLPDHLSYLAAAAAFGFAFFWPLVGAHRPAKVVQRACRLGLIVAILLPVVAVAVLYLWENSSGRPDLGMGGMMLYALPYVALGVAAVLVIFFGIGIRFSGRRLQDVKFH